MDIARREFAVLGQKQDPRNMLSAFQALPALRLRAKAGVGLSARSPGCRAEDAELWHKSVTLCAQTSHNRGQRPVARGYSWTSFHRNPTSNMGVDRALLLLPEKEVQLGGLLTKTLLKVQRHALRSLHNVSPKAWPQTPSQAGGGLTRQY